MMHAGYIMWYEMPMGSPLCSASSNCMPAPKQSMQQAAHAISIPHDWALLHPLPLLAHLPIVGPPPCRGDDLWGKVCRCANL